MKSVYLRLLTTLFAFAQVIAVFSEESNATVVCNITNKEESTITHNGVMYMLPEEELTLEFAITETQDIAEVNSLNLLLSSSAGDNTSYSLNCILTHGVVRILDKEFTLPNANVDYTVQVSMDYTVVPPVEPETPGEKEEETPAYDATRTLVYNFPTKLHLKQWPVVDEVPALKEYYYAGENVGVNVNTSGGYTDGWKFTWANGAESNSSQYAFVTTYQGAGANDQSFNVVVKNYAPDGKTVWFQETYYFPIYTYPAPQVNVVGDGNVTLLDGQEYTIGVETTGGVADTWEYNWMYQGTTMSHTGKTYLIDANNKSSEDRTDNYQLVVENSLPSGEKYSQTYNFTVCVKGIDVEWGSVLPTDVVEGDEIEAEVSIVGALKSSWNYTWNLEGENQLNEGNSFKFTAPEVNEEGWEDYTLSVKSQINEYVTGVLTISLSDSYGDGWNGCAIVVKQDGEQIGTATINTGGRNNTVQFTYDSSKEYTFYWTKGNYPDECSFSIAIDENVVYSANKSQCEAFSNSQLIYQIAPGVFSYTLYHDINVWDTPATEKTSLYDIALLHGQQYEFAIETTGGKPNGWSYEWFLDDVKISGATAKNYNATMQNTGSGVKHCVYKVIARNVTNGITRELEETFNAEVWPAVSETHSPENQDYYYGDAVNLSFNASGGYADGWDYTWHQDPVFGTVQLSLSDSYGDGWNGCAIVVKQDGEQIGTATINTGGRNNTVQFTYDSSKEYTFYWTKGSYPNECSFTIKINGVEVYTASTTQCNNFSNGALIHKVDKQEIELSKNNWYSYTIADSNPEVNSTDEFTLTVVNNHPKAPNGAPLYQKEITFKVTGWSHGSVSSMSFANNHEHYRSGDDIPVTVTTTGGYPNWSYKWYYNDELVATTADPQYTFQAQINEGQTSDERGVLTISMSDQYNDGWNGCELIVKQDGEYWGTATINNGNHNTVQFVYDPNCSYEFYWNVGSYSSECSFDIAIDDEVVFSANGSQCGSFSDGLLVYQIASQVHMFVVDQVAVVAENTIPANLHEKSCNGSREFRVYAVEEFADDFTMNQVTSSGGYNTYAIRSGNTLDFNVERATGGYNIYNDSYWYYTWYENGAVIKSGSAPGKNSYQIASVPGNNSEVKRVDTKTYHLEISNMGPYDQEWYNKVYEEKVLKVYARPQIPNKLMVKGNGTTNTLVCTISLTDEALEAREYLFVFGYTDASGKDHPMTPTPNRWCQMKNVSVNDAQKRFWVYTRWNYDEDTYVTSGRIFLDGNIEHEFDASCYNGNEVGVRGTTTDIQNFDADDIYFDGRRLVVNANHSVECIITVTSLDGKNLEINNLGSCSSFDETIDVSKYGRGIYIVRVKVGDKVINRKIVVS